MSLPVRIATLTVAFLAVVGGAVFIVIHYLLGGPPVENFTAGVRPDTGAQVDVVMQEDAQNTVSSKPDWGSYFIKSPTTGAWVHTTLFTVPAGSRVNMTILGYDGCTPLRNNYWSHVQGTIGGTVNVRWVDGEGQEGPAHNVSLINAWSGCNVGHTFAIPGLCIVVHRGGWFQFSVNNCIHSGNGEMESANGIEYRALQGAPSFRGSVISSTITRRILTSSNSELLLPGDDPNSRFAFEAIVAIGFPIGGAVSRIPSNVRTRSS